MGKVELILSSLPYILLGSLIYSINVILNKIIIYLYLAVLGEKFISNNKT